MPDGTAPSLEDRLAAVIASKDLPDRTVTEAQRIRDALVNPKRVTLMGPPAVGKAGVMALLAGQNLIPNDLSLGTIKLVHGAKPSTTMTVSDGNALTVDGLPDAEVVGMMSPVLTEIAAPLPALKKITLMRLAEADDIDGQVRAMKWAAKQSDVVIWCTHKLSKIERRMWDHMPDRIRDSAMVLATRLDDLGSSRTTAQRSLAAMADRDFAFVVAMDMNEALAASISSPVDRERLRDSGGMTLISTLLKELDKGRTNVMDRAEILLAKVQKSGVKPKLVTVPEPDVDSEGNDNGLLSRVAQAASAKVATPDPVAETEPAEVTAPTPADQVEVEAPVRSDLAPKLPDDAAFAEAAKLIDDKEPADAPKPKPKRSAKRKILEPEIFPDFELAPIEPEPAPTPEPQAEMPEVAVDACRGAVERLQKVGQNFEGADTDARDFLDASAGTLIWLDEHLADAGRIDHPRFNRLRRMTEDAADLVQLLKLEGDDDASEEAATVLLQMKRGFQAAVAA